MGYAYFLIGFYCFDFDFLLFGIKSFRFIGIDNNEIYINTD